MKKATENDYSTEELKNLASQTSKALERLCFLLGTSGVSNVQSEKEKQMRAISQSQDPGYAKIVPIDK